MDAPALLPLPATPQFDPEVAVALARALDALASCLEDAASSEAARAPATTADWAGFTRRWFDERHVALLARLRDAAAVARVEARLVTVAPVVLP